MRSPYARKLFRFFLLFSLFPAILITSLAYYITLESSRIGLEASDSDALDVTRYYTRRLNSRLKSDMDAYLADTSRLPSGVDLALRLNPDNFTMLSNPGSLEDSLIDRLAGECRSRTEGLVDLDGMLTQYVTGRIDSVTTACFGLVHDSQLSPLLKAARENRAAAGANRRLRSRYVVFLGLLFLLLTAVATAVAYFFSSRLSRNLARPLSELSDAAHRIATGDFNQQVTSTGTGEIRILIESFNRMAHQLESTTARLAQSERVAAWRNVARSFAHELRNPLQPILVSLYRIEKIINEGGDLSQLAEPVRAASEEVRHLTNLAERYSDLAKLPPPEIEETDVRELLISMAALYREELSAFDFQTRFCDDPVLVKLDPTYFREAIHNLLLNAAEASRPGDRLLLGLELTGDQARIQVQDFGLGMDNDTASSARMPYFTTKDKGTGLGLAVVEKVVSELGGLLQVSSEPGQGTTMTIIITGKGDRL